jgi:hypothetical protein
MTFLMMNGEGKWKIGDASGSQNDLEPRSFSIPNSQFSIITTFLPIDKYRFSEISFLLKNSGKNRKNFGFPTCFFSRLWYNTC